MRRLTVMLAVVGLLLVGVAPVGADPVEKTTYWVAECFEIVGGPERIWTAGQTVHIRGLQGLGQEYLLDNGAWVLDGTNSTLFNLNLTPSGDHGWGTFEVRMDTVGHFDGSFQLNPNGGTAHGQGVGPNAGAIAKVDLTPTLPAGFPEAPEGCGVIMIEILDH